jgi:hypothetical protein
MRFSTTILLFFISLLLWTCQNLEDATPAKRATFFRLYEPPYDLTTTDFIATTTGYVVLGNMSVPPVEPAVDSIVTVVFEVDKSGNRISDFKYYYGGTGKSIKQHPDGGYIIVGDSIKRDLNPAFVANAIVSSARILVINDALDLQPDFIRVISDESGNDSKTDFSGISVTINDLDEVVVLGTYVDFDDQTTTEEPERPFLINLTKNTLNELSINWIQQYPLVERDYKNARSIHTDGSKIIWASSISQENLQSTISYVSIPFVESNSQFLNASSIGENSEQLFIVNDIQPAKFNGFGYGIIGTYSEPAATDGSKSNIFFMRVDPNGTLIEGSDRYFDAILSANNTPLDDNTLSEIVDEGLAIAATTDGGFVLACSYETIPVKGFGERDIFLIKVNAIGDMMWNKIIGGTGDEVVTAIKETDDGGLILLGTNTLGQASSAFLIKTDRNGELKN